MRKAAKQALLSLSHCLYLPLHACFMSQNQDKGNKSKLWKSNRCIPQHHTETYSKSNHFHQITTEQTDKRSFSAVHFWCCKWTWVGLLDKSLHQSKLSSLRGASFNNLVRLFSANFPNMLQGHKRSRSLQSLLELKDLINHPEHITLGHMTRLHLANSIAWIFKLFVRQLPEGCVAVQL